ncbi:MAG: hypothetical protein DRI81_09600 [Chloroflexi bacterium]|nr:MAG: hypothetical protein DRI81_09600 [Chloroflexota bacterium]
MPGVPVAWAIAVGFASHLILHIQPEKGLQADVQLFNLTFAPELGHAQGVFFDRAQQSLVYAHQFAHLQ